MNNNKKYNFTEFVAAYNSKDFDELTPNMLEWAKKFLLSYNKIFLNEQHRGDCTKESQPCPFCVLENMLIDFREYTFDEKKWREENGV